MDKHLVRVGNSFGVIIERSICRLLGMTAGTELRISTDGRRIVIEPVAAPAIRPAEQLDAHRLVSSVAYAMPVELHERMHPAFTGRRACVKAVIWAESLMADPEPGDELFLRRYQLCLDAHRAGASWEDAVERAVLEVIVPEETLEQARARRR